MASDKIQGGQLTGKCCVLTLRNAQPQPQPQPHELTGTYRWRTAQSDGGAPGCRHASGAKQHRDQNL
ncbi:hypothetical protein HR51_26240 [Burkholderia cepacia]|nr:hypothetical protein HR51_26240 [Burkholderia cepacia]